MDLSFDSDDLAFRDEVRAWLAEHVPSTPLPSLETEEGFAAHRQWEAQLHEARLSVVSWPEEFGGREASLVQWLLFEEEYYAAGAPARVGQNGIFLLAPTLFEHGTLDQQRRFLPRMASCDDIWAQAWSEPEAGSDLASLRSRAHRVDGGWVLSGQKTWSSRAAFADWAFGLFRTDPDTQRHKGLTYFVFPLDAEGVTVRPIGRLDGKPAFAELFLDEVFVPDSDVLGAVDDGWRVAMSTASSERGLSLRSPGRFLAAAGRLLRTWRERGDGGAANAPQSGITDRVVDAWIGAQAYRLATFDTVTRVLDGGSIGAEASANKVYWSEMDIALHEAAWDLLGAHGELAPAATEAPESGAWLDGYLFSLAGPIYAGTNEIQRNVIAERVLGLPRGSR